MTMLGGYHGFIFRPSYKAIADLPVAERAAVMRRPEVRERILSETDEPTDTGEFLLAMVVMNNLGPGVLAGCRRSTTNPTRRRSIAGTGRVAWAWTRQPTTTTCSPQATAAASSPRSRRTSHDGTLEPSREMLLDRHTVSGLSDAGAHVMMISDCSGSTFHLTHWVRDRTKGPRVPLQTAVHKLTGAPAQMYGFTDRGFIRDRHARRCQRHRPRTIDHPGARSFAQTCRPAPDEYCNRQPGTSPGWSTA